MTFLNPLYFIALAAAAIPILLHLLNLRKARVIEFSSLAFLKELQKSKIRKLKIRQWILLALRTLIIVFLVLSFTRPAMRSSFGFLPGTKARTSVVIILDDSFSMTASDERGQMLKQAREAVRAVLDVLEPGDEVALLRVSDAKKENVRFTEAFNAISGDLESLRPSFARVPYRDALVTAAGLINGSVNINREVYLLTDNQRSQFENTAAGGNVKMFDPGVRFFVVPFGGKPAENEAVTRVELRNAVLEKDKPVTIAATLSNNGSTPVRGGLVSVFLNGERVAQKAVDIDAGSSQSAEFTVTPRNTGFMDGFIELEDDLLPEDNKRWFSLHVPDNLRVLLAGPGGMDGTVLKLAMLASRTESNPGSVTLTETDRNALSSVALDRYDVVVLNGASQLPQPGIQRLAGWVRAGGGLLLFPDAEGDNNGFINTVLPALGLPRPAGMIGSANKNDGPVSSFGAVDFQHPIFATVFQSGADKKPEVESPQIKRMVRLRGDEHAQQLIGTTSGDAFLLDARLDKGRVMVCAVSPSFDWSDFAVKGVFVPLMHRSMFYLASREDDVLNVNAGQTFEAALPSHAASGALTLTSPSGASSRLTPRVQPSGVYVTLDRLDEPGVYTISVDNTVLRKIAVNLDEAESNLEKISDNDRAEYLRLLGVANPTILSRDVNVREAVTQVRYGVELWKYFIILALICAAAEMIVEWEKKSTQSMTDMEANK
jgi:hypothetical protein